jgi:plastocyanin
MKHTTRPWALRRLVACLLALAIAVGAFMEATAVAQVTTASHSQQKQQTKHKHKSKKKKKKKKKKTATTNRTTSVAPTTTVQCTAAQPGAPTSAYDTFWQHLQTAHLDQSVEQQIAAITGNFDGYVLAHTVLVQQMLDPSVQDVSQLPAAFQQLVSIFEAHVAQAHLEQSPLQQVQALVGNPDGYVLLHTAWIQAMLQPLEDWQNQYLSGTPGYCQPVSTGGGSAPAASGPQAVAISGHAYSPKDLTVPAGTTVTWTNQDSDPHTVTSMHGGSLGSKTLNKGDTYSYTFSQAGTYMYYCTIHPDMQGSVTVQ